jgi:hypothetical protein
MRNILSGLALFLPIALFAADVRPGDTLNDVRSVLGVPRGHLHVGGRDLLYFDRGDVELRDNIVTRVTLVSIEEQAAREAKRTADAVKTREEQEIRRARLVTEGEALKARKLADAAFGATPPAFQVAFWQDFSRRYPDVSSAEQLAMVQARLDDQLAEKRARALQEERMAELEDRIAAAEAQSEAAARSIRVRSYYSSYDGHTNYYPFNPGRVEYRFYATPLPYATSPGIPPAQPTYRNRDGSVTTRPADRDARADPNDRRSRYPF